MEMLILFRSDDDECVNHSWRCNLDLIVWPTYELFANNDLNTSMKN